MKSVGMMPVYNEEDIIKETIEHTLAQGISLVVLDNGSTDNTFEICKKFEKKGLIKLDRFLTKNFDRNFSSVLRALYDLVLFERPDWIVKIDADEFLESGIKGMTLKDRIIQADTEGYNLIQFDFFSFITSDKDNEEANSIKEKLCYYTWEMDFKYSAWKYFPGINVEFTPHYPVFPEEIRYKIYPKKFAIRHYPFRNKEQFIKKVNAKTRGIDYSKTKGRLTKYTRKLTESGFYGNVDHNHLTKYSEDGKWNYKRTYYMPWADNSPQKEDIFNEDGSLKNKITTLREVQIELRELRRKNLELRLRHEAFKLKNSIRKKIQKTIYQNE